MKKSVLRDGSGIYNRFCEKIYALLDPTSTDKTEEILRTEFKNDVEIIYQDRNLGDSDYSIQGETKSLIMHNNITKFVHDYIDTGEWFMMLAADERIALESIPQLMKDLEYAKIHHNGTICHERLYEVITIHHDNIIRNKNSTYNIKNIADTNQSDIFTYVIDFAKFTLRHSRIDCKTPNWKKTPKPHTGYSERYNPLITHVPLWHFHRVKHNQIKPTDWRDGMGGLDRLFDKYNGRPPIMQMRIPFDCWKYSIEDSGRIYGDTLNDNLRFKTNFLNGLKNHIDWDEWRKNYDKYSFTEMQEFYNRIYDKIPDQCCYDPSLSVFLREIDGPIYVYEFGGWKGELADDVMDEKDDILFWQNYDICNPAIEKTICKNPKYIPILINDFVWNYQFNHCQLKNIKSVFVASHSLEHIKEWQIKRILENIQPDIICIDTPHGDWTGYEGSHILNLSKEGLDNLIIQLGYKKIFEKNDVRCFEKIINVT